MCAEEGRIIAAVVPDHIDPLALGGSDHDDNIRCLCAEHHRQVTAEQFGHRQVQEVDAGGWPVERGGSKNGGKPPFLKGRRGRAGVGVRRRATK